MSALDWMVLSGTLLFIVGYGIWKTRNINSTESYILGDRDLKWWTIGLSIMATQASAITFLSTPGQAYDDGMRFAQFYFGLPLAMVILCIFVLPLYYKLKVYTAYEYLEGRFDLKTRTFTAILFLVQRGLAAGITIYAPSIILSTIMGWNLNITVLVIGFLVILYTVAGGTKAVSQTQKQQMVIILSGMFIAFIILVSKLPADISFGDAVGVAGKMGKLNILDFNFDLKERYNMWSAMLGGTFLFLSYFGTDQSQVARYLSGKSLTESRLGLLFNGIFKVPMQFMILFVGMMVFVFFQFNKAPIHFNNANLENIQKSSYASEYKSLEDQYEKNFEQKQEAIRELVAVMNTEDQLNIAQAQKNVLSLHSKEKEIREDTKTLILKNDKEAIIKDKDYVFINFIINYLPTGLIGLLLAVIFSAAMSSTSSELNALASTTTVDLYRRSLNPGKNDQHYLLASKGFTILWGLIALLFAIFGTMADNLIQLVNIIGSIFYGVILGVFIVAFFCEQKGNKAISVGMISLAGLFLITGNLLLGIESFGGLAGFSGLGALLGFLLYNFVGEIKGTPVFIAAVISEILVVTIFVLDAKEIVNISYLWLNLIGCSLVVFFAGVLQLGFGRGKVSKSEMR